MKFFIFDSSNDGIVWVGQKIVVANKLKEGLLDCDMGILNPLNPTYNLLTNENIDSGHFYWDGKNVRVKQMNIEHINAVYLNKKRLAKLREVSMYTLNNYVVWAYRKTQTFPHVAIDSELDSVLKDCDPDNNVFSFAIIEYALTCGMTNLEAYKQLRLRVDNYKSQRMRTYSYFDYYSNLINKATTDEDVALINSDMHKKFIKDCYI